MCWNKKDIAEPSKIICGRPRALNTASCQSQESSWNRSVFSACFGFADLRTCSWFGRVIDVWVTRSFCLNSVVSLSLCRRLVFVMGIIHSWIELNSPRIMAAECFHSGFWSLPNDKFVHSRRRLDGNTTTFLRPVHCTRWYEKLLLLLCLDGSKLLRFIVQKLPLCQDTV